MVVYDEGCIRALVVVASSPVSPDPWVVVILYVMSQRVDSGPAHVSICCHLPAESHKICHDQNAFSCACPLQAPYSVDEE